MLVEATPKQLQQALDRRADGATMEVATGLHPAAAELEKLVALAESIQSLPVKDPPASAVAAARERYLIEGGRRRAAWVHEPRRIRHRTARHPAPTHHFRWAAVVAVGVIAALIAGPLLSFAAMMSSADSPLYGIRLQGERLLLTLTRDPVNQASVRIDIANQRFRDAEDMADRGNADLAISSVEAFYSQLGRAGEQLAAQSKRDGRWMTVRDKYVKAEGKTIDSIIHLLNEHGDKESAQQVADLQQGFGQRRQDLDSRLAVAPTGTGQGGSTIKGAPAQPDQPTQPTATP